MTSKLITVADTTQLLAQNLLTLETESVPLARANGRVLAEDIVADRPFPPFNRVMMDGIAIAYDRFAAGQRRFTVAGIQAAGQPSLVLQNVAQCLEVMTGAVLPIGVDTVVRYEDVKIENGVAEIQTQSIDNQQNVHKTGSDRAQNEALILRGGKITAAEIGTAATVGKAFLEVVELPRVAVVSTGDELVGVGQMPQPHQIRRSNAFAVIALLKDKLGIEADIFHYNDNAAEITEGVQKLTRQYEVVILSGGISEGKYDFVPNALTDNGIETLFHGVSQRPGKPFWFGKMAESKRLTRATQVVFALPGNPVSTFMCAVRYLIPFLETSFKNTILSQNAAENTFFKAKTYARLTENVLFKPDLTYFLQVKTENTEGGEIWAKPIAGGGSGDLANLNDVDGFLELPANRSEFLAGEAFPFWAFRMV
jgi:molybdopterin molybdotransferase